MAIARPNYMRWHGDGIVFKHHIFDWVLPASFQPHLKYDPSRLPMVIHLTEISPDRVTMWEMTAERLTYDRRVFAMSADNESHYLRMSIERIRNGYSGSAALPNVPFA